MSRLPARPEKLRIFPTPLSLEQRSAAHGHVGEADVTFTALWQLLGHHGQHRSLSIFAARVALRDVLADSALQVHAANPWEVRNVHKALLELRLAGVTARRLQGLRASPELTVLIDVLERYEHMLEQRDAFDLADVQRQAVLDVAQGRLPYGLQAVREVEVLAGQDLLGARLDLLNALAARGIQVTVRLPWDPERPAAFAWPEAVAHAVESRGHPTLQVRFDDRVGTGPLADLRAAQWTDRQASAPATVLQVSAGSEHAHQVVWQISQWLAAQVPAHTIAVVVADPTWMAELRAAFEGAGVPVAGRETRRLSDAPLLQRWRAAWALPEHGFLRDSVLDVWQAAGVPIVTPEGLWFPDRVAWELRRAGWRSCRLEPVIAALRRVATSAVVEAVAAVLQPWLDSWSAVPAQGSLETYLQATASSLAHLATPEDAEALAAAHGLLSALVPWPSAADPSSALPTGGDWTQAEGGAARLPWSKQEWLDWVRLCADEVLLPSRPQPAGAVRLLTPDEVVGGRFSRVLFAGANLGVFPRQREADAVLTDAVRAEINRCLGPRLWQYGPLLGRGALPGEARDLWLWQELLLACQDVLVVTVSCASGEAAMGQSEVVDELLRSLTGTPGPYSLPVAPASYTRGGAWPIAWAPLAGVLRAADATAADGLPPVVRDAALALRRRCLPRSAPLPAAVHQRLQDILLNTVQSTSRLDVLGMCAFRFFASAVLGLSAEDPPILSANPREQGSVAHAGLHRVYRDLLARGGLRAGRLQPEATLARAAEAFWQGADAVLAEVHVHPLLREATLQQAWLAVQVQLERDLGSRGLAEPRLLEYTFDDRPGAAAPELHLWDAAHARCLRVRGSIDRVDVDAQAGALWTLDYKRTVSKRSPHRHFQLGLYSAVARRDLAAEGSAVQAAWIALTDGRRTLAEGLCGDADAVLTDMGKNLWARLDRVLEGDVSPDPDGAELCARCDFRPLCRYDAGDLGVAEEGIP